METRASGERTECLLWKAHAERRVANSQRDGNQIGLHGKSLETRESCETENDTQNSRNQVSAQPFSAIAPRLADAAHKTGQPSLAERLLEERLSTALGARAQTA